MKKFILLIVVLSALTTNAQKVEGTELGLDGFFGASNLGGSFGIGVKYGFKLKENYLVGPSIRFQRSWNSSYTSSTKYGYNTYGVGIFGHARYFNYIFLAGELEFMRTPLTSYGAISSNSVWAPVLFLGGGFSREFNESIRINAGIYYDVIDHVSSPFRQGYFMKRANGSYIPAIYRIAFFFPLT
jgi:hypothetical protein